MDRGDIQGVGSNVPTGIQGFREDVPDVIPCRQVEFQGAPEEEETGSQSLRATSTSVATVAKSLAAHHDDPAPILCGENNSDTTSSAEVPLEQIDVNGNQEEDQAISEARATFSIGALMMREDIQGGIVEASQRQEAVGEEQDMELDHSLMEKTRESQIDLGSGGQEPRSRSRSE